MIGHGFVKSFIVFYFFNYQLSLIARTITIIKYVIIKAIIKNNAQISTVVMAYNNNN